MVTLIVRRSGADKSARVFCLTIKAAPDANGTYETTEHAELFAAKASEQAEETPTYDAESDLTCGKPRQALRNCRDGARMLG